MLVPMTDLPLPELDHLPDGLLESPPQALADRLGGPALIHLPGRRTLALFVSVLLHGNEHTGWRALQRLLGDARGRTLPRALSIFVGNVAAARADLRRLDDQPDWNRIWPGTDTPDGPERRMAQAVFERLRARGAFACVDVHNNTGRNPHYGCVTRLDAHTLSLAALFARVGVHFEATPRGTLTAAFAAIAPSVAIECGRSGDAAHDRHAAQYLDALLHLSEWPAHPPAPADLELYRTHCAVRVPAGVDFAFGDDGDAPLRFPPDLDTLNFRELPAGHALAHARAGLARPLAAIDDDGRDVAAEVFEVDAHGAVRLRRPMMPAMLTLDARAIRQDCVGYLMRRVATR